MKKYIIVLMMAAIGILVAGLIANLLNGNRQKNADMKEDANGLKIYVEDKLSTAIVKPSAIEIQGNWLIIQPPPDIVVVVKPLIGTDKIIPLAEILALKPDSSEKKYYLGLSSQKTAIPVEAGKPIKVGLDYPSTFTALQTMRQVGNKLQPAVAELSFQFADDKPIDCQKPRQFTRIKGLPGVLLSGAKISQGAEIDLRSLSKKGASEVREKIPGYITEKKIWSKPFWKEKWKTWTGHICQIFGIEQNEKKEEHKKARPQKPKEEKS